METINYCDVCGEPDADYASVFKPGAWLCQDPEACLLRLASHPVEERVRVMLGEPATPRELA
jgi:hypothetical protein